MTEPNAPLREEKSAAAGAALPETTPQLPGIERPRPQGRFVGLREEISPLRGLLLGALCLVVCWAIWWALTRGAEPEDRFLSPGVLPSPSETFAAFPNLWFDRALTRNTVASLRRVVLGFGLAALLGVPVGIFCGCFRWLNAFFAPLTTIGRNIPVAALIPLTFSLFGIGEFQKVMFLFIACVAFVVMDSATAVAEISSRYVDTAYTLGASRWQIITKVLVPLAMPSIFNSLRLLFGLAFGYIMLAEVIQLSEAAGGLGSIINISQRRGNQSQILLVLMIIPLVALAIDWLLFWIQRQLFPYQYSSEGLLHSALRTLLRAWEDLKRMILGATPLPPDGLSRPPTSAPGASHE